MQVHQSLPSVNRNLGDVPDQDISRKWNSESYLYNGEQDESAVLVEFDSVVLQEYCLELWPPVIEDPKSGYWERRVKVIMPEWCSICFDRTTVGSWDSSDNDWQCARQAQKEDGVRDSGIAPNTLPDVKAMPLNEVDWVIVDQITKVG